MKKVYFLLLVWIFLFSGNCANAQTSELWGMTLYGGTNNDGVIFKVKTDGSGDSVVFNFNRIDGQKPSLGLFQANNGILYGMTQAGGSHSYGVIFSFDPFHNIYTKLFDLDSANGSFPLGSIIQADNDMLYGVTQNGGVKNAGVVFDFNITNNTFAKLFDFDSINGKRPYFTKLLEASDGKLYGMTNEGGAYNRGVIFSVNPASNAFNKEYDFSFLVQPGRNPRGSLIESGGKFYGLTTSGGDNLFGTIFSYDPTNHNYIPLFSPYIPLGVNGFGRLTKATDGKLYALMEYAGLVVSGSIIRFDSLTNNCVKVLDFDSSKGYNPLASLIQLPDGKLYGTTFWGGSNDRGVVFNFNPIDSAYSIILNCDSVNGMNPNGDLIELNYTLGINELRYPTSEFSLSPNPATTTVTISIDEDMLGGTTTITDIMGRKMAIVTLATHHLPLAISDFPNGIYFITVANERQSATRKLVVSK